MQNQIAPLDSPVSEILFCTNKHMPIHMTEFDVPVPQNTINYTQLCSRKFSYALAILPDGRTIKYNYKIK